MCCRFFIATNPEKSQGGKYDGSAPQVNTSEVSRLREEIKQMKRENVWLRQHQDQHNNVWQQQEQHSRNTEASSLGKVTYYDHATRVLTPPPNILHALDIEEGGGARRQMSATSPLRFGEDIND
jgi:hypothetical protein